MATAENTLVSFPHSSRWLVSKQRDWLWLLGGAILGYATIGLLFAGAPITPFLLFMLLLLEGPHVFATATRSYLDREERKRFGRFLWLIVPFCLIGPAMVEAGFGDIFFLLAFTWLHFHIAKQHFGFVALYKRKSGENDDYRLDRYFLLGSLTLPLFGFWVHKYFPHWAAWPEIVATTVALYLVTVGIYCWHQYQKSKSRPLAIPKLYLMALVIPLQWLAFAYASRSPYGIKAAGVAITFCHSIQYHYLNLLYHRTAAEEKSIQASGTMPLWFNIGGYWMAVLMLNALFNVAPRVVFSADVIIAGLWGISFMHYVLDGRLWKTKDYPLLGRALNLPGTR
jgi:hypothetical protein